MEAALRAVGLPVKCRKCSQKGFVKPNDYNGWYRSKWGPRSKRWLCPDHADEGKAFDKHFTDRFKTPEGGQEQAKPEEKPEETTVDELYKLLD